MWTKLVNPPNCPTSHLENARLALAFGRRRYQPVHSPGPWKHLPSTVEFNHREPRSNYECDRIKQKQTSNSLILRIDPLTDQIPSDYPYIPDRSRSCSAVQLPPSTLALQTSQRTSENREVWNCAWDPKQPGKGSKDSPDCTWLRQAGCGRPRFLHRNSLDWPIKGGRNIPAGIIAKHIQNSRRASSGKPDLKADGT